MRAGLMKGVTPAFGIITFSNNFDKSSSRSVANLI